MVEGGVGVGVGLRCLVGVWDRFKINFVEGQFKNIFKMFRNAIKLPTNYQVKMGNNNGVS